MASGILAIFLANWKATANLGTIARRLVEYQTRLPLNLVRQVEDFADRLVGVAVAEEAQQFENTVFQLFDGKSG